MIDPKTIPTSPGVYQFKDKDGKVIYVGKAKNLRNRVRSYFSKSDKSSKTQLLVKHIADAEFILVENEIEALLLENRLIKKIKPKYNISLKDSKTYAYLKLTDEKFPRLLTTRRVTKKGTYFGPYTDGYARYQIQQLATKLFQLRTCRQLPKRACLNYHIGLCTAPCVHYVDELSYAEQVAGAIRFLKGETREVLGRLSKEMKSASAREEYEIALEKRRQIEAIEMLKNRQHVDLIRDYDQDVIAYRAVDSTAYFALFTVKKGVVMGKKSFSFEYEEDILQNFVKMYYSGHTVPREVLLNESCWKDEDEKRVVEGYLSRIRGGPVMLTVPERGKKVALVRLAEKNILVENELLIELQEKLNLPTVPNVIECFDISNLGKDDIVAGMTRWVGGRPDKNGYRKFEMKTLSRGQDDFGSMREAVYRRYKRLQEEGGELPDLIMVDGGLGQLNSSIESLIRLGLQVPIISIAKREEELYVPGEDEPHSYDKKSPMMILLRKIRDNTHRYAITYNRKKREMRMRKETTE